ncbi:SIR2 family NAD-dependent protein deacylase [Solitalea canadensis]|uniref:NAD-dependent protein deacylase n=1 Tax=Solitalea canadensis (strain ATCC 29591 / DSM 3403 / JCM 21819 / LMG 8368 / NBRC 15130 / NCIMB 12057 / USAM 9D) TaxID=929556 RepID=H8KVJ8_SOLCM|nr:NAD-dependent deacylase [Solitalea canadensis]AFD06501.1 NAD-dependent protein deacetylase, SIR2 family [Solitalea canadensis DSM 3403]
MKKLVILTGAGISAESGLKTFRDSDGLWEGYDINEVATPEGWRRNPELVQDFYNMRRKAVVEAQPNAAHYALADLEKYFEVVIITQNIDNLHEKAGSTNVLHLHGIITKSQSSLDPNLTYDIQGYEIKMGEKCEKGSQLRPHVVWFGEAVPMIDPAAKHCSKADYFAVIGTSLQVYPAAGLMNFVPFKIPKFLVDPNAPDVKNGVTIINEKASIGVPLMAEQLLSLLK